MAGSHSPSPVFSLSLPPFLLLLYLFFPPHVSLITIRRSANPQIYPLSPLISVSWLLLELSNGFSETEKSVQWQLRLVTSR
ncbi:hypothetical protein V6N11_057798 [Hibiscus sabdariffa]|uniref:Uncharacterized protein n=1 Tax=Hibiscus sabdariffa TaxID=183260 RepID=A0ABR1ZSD0_9ROSI